MVKDKIIELLRDDEEYYNGTGRNYLSVSNINKMVDTPEVFLDWMDGKEEKTFNLNFVIGSALHTIVLEGIEKFNRIFTIIDKDEKDKPVLTRANKFYKTHEAPKGTILLKKEYDHVQSMVAALDEAAPFNQDIMDCVSVLGGESEVPNVVEMFGVQWKMKVDKVSDDFVLDLKTTGDLKRFMYNAKSYNYDAQAALYSTAFGKPMKFVVVDKSNLNIGIFECDDSFISSGMEKIEMASDFYKEWIKPITTGVVKRKDIPFGSLITYQNLM